MKKEEECGKVNEEVVSLRVEVDKLNKNLKRSQVLDDILSCQISPCDKKGLGYTTKSPCEEDTSSKSLKVKYEENPEIKVCILQHPNHSESQNKIGSIATTRRYVDVLKKHHQKEDINLIKDKDQ